ncbi:MAG TPA: DMT family transporter [Verrucomicrobiae bacterium]|jgi:drug/metabolite transporter (DMT)-like permease|nr:DMT family transporter [Verrucomicrobiae bacterium]
MPYLVLGGAQIAVGAAAIFARYALTGAGPLAVSASRLAIAAVLLLVFAAFMRSRPQHRPTRRENVILAAAGVALALHFAGWVWSLEYTTVAISTLLVATTPIWTALYDALVRKRGLSPPAMAGFVGGGVGAIMVVGFDAASPPISGHQWLGVALALLGSFAIGAYLLLVREVRSALDTRAIVTRTYSWAALALIFASAIARQPPPAIGATAAWGGILAMALISQLLGHTAINASLRWFTPSAISFAALLEPVFAAALALALFHEALPPLALIGGLILLTSIAFVLREERLGDWAI